MSAITYQPRNEVSRPQLAKNENVFVGRWFIGRLITFRMTTRVWFFGTDVNGQIIEDYADLAEFERSLEKQK